MDANSLELYLAEYKQGQWFGFKDSGNKSYSNIVVYDDTVLPSVETIVYAIAEKEYMKEISEYKINRSREYPSYSEYLDGLVKGDQDQIDAYIAACQAVKDKYPKTEIDEAELASRKEQALLDYRVEEYRKAVKRLEAYEVAVGREETTKTVVIGQEYENGELVDVTETVVVPAIDPVPATVTSYDEENNEVAVENPLITKDNEERAAAQAIVDATPQEVIDAYNAL